MSKLEPYLLLSKSLTGARSAPKGVCVITSACFVRSSLAATALARRSVTSKPSTMFVPIFLRQALTTSDGSFLSILNVAAFVFAKWIHSFFTVLCSPNDGFDGDGDGFFVEGSTFLWWQWLRRSQGDAERFPGEHGGQIFCRLGGTSSGNSVSSESAEFEGTRLRRKLIGSTGGDPR